MITFHIFVEAPGDNAPARMEMERTRVAVNKLAVRDGDYTVATLGQILFTGDGYANIRGAVYTGAAAQYLNKHIAKASEMQRTADEEEL